MYYRHGSDLEIFADIRGIEPKKDKKKKCDVPRFYPIIHD